MLTQISTMKILNDMEVLLGAVVIMKLSSLRRSEIRRALARMRKIFSIKMMSVLNELTTAGDLRQWIQKSVVEWLHEAAVRLMSLIKRMI
jgi:hypothetical protein